MSLKRFWSQKIRVNTKIFPKKSLLLHTDIVFREGYFLRLHFEGKNRSSNIRNPTFEDKVAWLLGEPKSDSQPRAFRSDHTQIGRGSYSAILKFSFTINEN